MKKKTCSLIIFYLLAATIMVGCQNKTPAIDGVLTPEVQIEDTVSGYPTEIQTSPTVSATEQANISENSTATPILPVENQAPILYSINAQLDYSAKTLDVDQVIRINDFPNEIEQMTLVVESNRYYGGFELHTLEVGTSVIGSYSLDGNQLRFDLPEAVGSNGNVEVHLNYYLFLPEIPPPSEMYKPQPYGYSDRQLNLVDWYPYVPPLDENSAWVIHKPPYFGESLVYLAADYEVSLAITGNQLPLTVAASSPPNQVDNTYSFRMNSARTFAISISPYYSMIENEINGVKIITYSFSGYEAQNQMVMQNATEALSLFSELYGPLSMDTVSVVQADFLDGMEYSGLYFVSKGFYDLYDGSVQGYLSLITVHEMAHQWWFGEVGNDQAMEPWLDEGLSTFAELQYMERYYPELTDWWWYYRVNVYEPQGKIDLSIYEYPSYIAYRNAVYLRGGAFFAELRTTLGIDDFNRGMSRYYQENRGKIATKLDLLGALQAEAGALPDEIVGEYFSDAP